MASNDILEDMILSVAVRKHPLILRLERNQSFMSNSTEKAPTKQCSVCGQTYPAITKYWHRNKCGKYGLRPNCKKCECERKRKWYHVDENKQRHDQLSSYHSKKYRMRKYNADGTHTKQELKEQYERQKGKCHYCGCNLDGEYHTDHVIPLSRGGSDDISNIVYTCPTCNLSKGNLLPHEWDGTNRLL